jgi:predicted RNA-binding protein YlqC (UPF0109 family)
MDKEEIQELLESILRAMVTKPEGVKVTKTVDDMGVLLSVELGEGDAGLVIGRGGKTIQAIRLIINAIGMQNRAKINIKLLVPERIREGGFNHFGHGENKENE